MDGFTCKHCGRPIAVPASTCPWCSKPIMVICANCKAYSDDESEFCDHCGEPLVADKMEELALIAHHPDVARLAKDQQRAQVVASAVVQRNAKDMFFDRGPGRQTVLVQLLGSPRDTIVVPSGVILAAYAYLSHHGHCGLRLAPEDRTTEVQIMLNLLRPWDAQKSVESLLTDLAGRALTTREATDKMLRDLMGFRVAMAQADSFRRADVHDASQHSAPAAIDQQVRVTALPDFDLQEASRDVYRMLVSFVDEDQERARALASEIKGQLRWFERYRQDPSLRLSR